mmetsp:Transcript_2974/g.5678  ORF Transcript_2974/g.5678 Transcript_2974/m.5678 type:complete len:424 (-) Transcript_2974:2099-3370(-)
MPLNGEVFLRVWLKSDEEAVAVLGRCVLVKAAFIEWGHGVTYTQCLHDAMKRLMQAQESADEVGKRRLVEGNSTFKCVVQAFGRRYSVPEQLDRMHRFRDILEKFSGGAKMKNPDEEVWILEDHFPRMSEITRPDVEVVLRQVFLARKITSGAAVLGDRYSLKRRAFIGTTSMDAELAFIMANQAGVVRGSLVLDPCVGTASTIVSAAVYGAHVVGCDLDWKVLKGSPGRNIQSNFAQYHLQTPVAIMRADLLHSAWRQSPGGIFDAVVCDPPYGIREGIRSSSECEARTLEQSKTVRVRVADSLLHLLQLAAETLRPGGRLVYWLPTTSDFDPVDLPTHPDLRLVSCSEQALTIRMRRRLVTMERTTSPWPVRLTALSTHAGERRPAHFNFAANILRDPRRREDWVDSRLTKETVPSPIPDQ